MLLRLKLLYDIVTDVIKESNIMGTARLYQQDVYIKEWDAEITKIDGTAVYIDRTAFFPEGGGQSCDTGKLSVADQDVIVDVTDVRESGPDVAHTVSDAGALHVGNKVHCTLDWDRRFDNMQRHCGEHILSSIFYRECGGVNRGFHMGDDYMTIDISLEDEPTALSAVRPDEIDAAIAGRCELLANEVVWSDAPVTVLRFDSRTDAEKMPLRKKLAFDEDISIVCVGSPENAADCVACCGTHPSSAGQVGLIKIYKVEKYKDMFRVYFEAGRRALLDYDKKHDILTELSNDYSSSVDDFPEKIRSQAEKLASVKGELVHIKKMLIEAECSKLDTILSDGETSPVVYELDELGIDDAFNMAKNYMGSPRTCGRLILLYSTRDSSYVLASSGEVDCGALVKEYAGFYNGKGGGSDVSARAIFSNRSDAELFADLLSKHLR